MDAGRYCGNADLLQFSRLPLAPHPDQQSAGAHHEGNPPAHARCRDLSLWQIGTHAGSGQVEAYCRYPMGNEALPENGFAAGSRPARDLRGINPDRDCRQTNVRKILDTTVSVRVWNGAVAGGGSRPSARACCIYRMRAGQIADQSTSVTLRVASDPRFPLAGLACT